MTSPGKIDTPRIRVSTTYHGVKVTEDYRWLEAAMSEEVRRRVEEIAKVESVGWGRVSYGMEFEGPRRAGAACFVLKREPPKQQPFLVALADLGDVSGARAW